jgi:CRP-like cAMP-binding protein
VLLNRVLSDLRQAGIATAHPKQDLFLARMPDRHVDSLELDGRAELLRHTELFANLRANELRLLAEQMLRRFYEAGEVLITAGDDGESMYVVFEGLLDVRLPGPDGKERRIASIGAGDFLGEMSLLTGEPRSATVVADTDAVVFEITRDPIEELLERRPEIADILSNAAATRRLRASSHGEGSSESEGEEDRRTLAMRILDRMRDLLGAPV